MHIALCSNFFWSQSVPNSSHPPLVRFDFQFLLKSRFALLTFPFANSLNPVWDEKLLFHVKKFESSFVIQFNILDWDKISGNDFVGVATLPLSELLEDCPVPNEDTGLHDGDGKHEMKEFKVSLSLLAD